MIKNNKYNSVFKILVKKRTIEEKVAAERIHTGFDKCHKKLQKREYHWSENWLFFIKHDTDNSHFCLKFNPPFLGLGISALNVNKIHRCSTE